MSHKVNLSESEQMYIGNWLETAGGPQTDTPTPIGEESQRSIMSKLDTVSEHLKPKQSPTYSEMRDPTGNSPKLSKDFQPGTPVNNPLDNDLFVKQDTLNVVEMPPIPPDKNQVDDEKNIKKDSNLIENNQDRRQKNVNGVPNELIVDMVEERNVHKKNRCSTLKLICSVFTGFFLGGLSTFYIGYQYGKNQGKTNTPLIRYTERFEIPLYKSVKIDCITSTFNDNDNAYFDCSSSTMNTTVEKGSIKVGNINPNTDPTKVGTFLIELTSRYGNRMNFTISTETGFTYHVNNTNHVLQIVENAQNLEISVNIYCQPNLNNSLCEIVDVNSVGINQGNPNVEINHAIISS